MPTRPPRHYPLGLTPEQASRQRHREHDQHRGSARQRGYTSRWEKARKAFLAEDSLCVMCLPVVTPATVVDHIVPHRGDQELFWDQDNWQALCKPHHDAFKQRQEHGNAQAVGLDGWPIP